MSAIPDELRARPSWVIWRYEDREGKRTKVPYDACDVARRASTTDPDTWSAYGHAAAALERGDAAGIGFVFSADDPYCGVDLDGCRDAATREVDPAAARVVAGLDSYTEASPSGTGLHVIVRASLDGGRRRTGQTPWNGEIEIYDTGRFFTMTGAHVAGTPTGVNDRQDQVDAVRAQLLPEPEPTPPRAPVPVSMDDAELLERARGARNGAAFDALWNGDKTGYGSASEADLALCGALAFWSGGDPARVDSLFRASGLMRDKWDQRRGQSTYGAQTIAKALEGRTEFYKPPAAPDDAKTTTTTSALPRAGDLRNPDIARARLVSWAWKGRIPIGRVSLLVGNEGVGKGTTTAWLASTLSRGELPGDLKGEAANVLIVGDEDALDDTWTPRLYAAGADMAHVFFPPEDAAELDITTVGGVAQLRTWVKAHTIRVVIFDALLDHLGGASVDEFKPKPVRNALRGLRRLAREQKFAAVGAMHPRKGNAVTFRDLVAASHQFNAVSRSSLLLAEHPVDEARRVLVRGKGNLASGVKALEFTIASNVFVLNGDTFDQPYADDWQESELKIGDVLPGGGAGRPRADDKRDVIEAALTAEPQSAKAIAKATGIPRSTVRGILREFKEDGEATSTPSGWVAGKQGGERGGGENQMPLIFATPQNPDSNGKMGGAKAGANRDASPPPRSAIFDDGDDQAAGS